MFGRLTFLGLIVIFAATALTFVVEPEASTADTTPTPVPDTQTPQPEPTAEPTPEPAPPPQPEPAPVTNRADCNQIRGTNYLSAEERTWFLANCVPR
jgi:hypothetical protein